MAREEKTDGAAQKEDAKQTKERVMRGRKQRWEAKKEHWRQREEGLTARRGEKGTIESKLGTRRARRETFSSSVALHVKVVSLGRSRETRHLTF